MAAAPKKTNVPEDRPRLYQRLLKSVDGVAEKSNFGSAYTAVNGNMYSMISSGPRSSRPTSSEASRTPSP